MNKALGRRDEICVRCINSGEIKPGDSIVIIDMTLLQALRYLIGVVWRQKFAKPKGHE